MPFLISGLDPANFDHLFGLTEGELAFHRARRVTVDGPGYPERIAMRDAEPRERLLLINYEHQDADSPFRASHAVYVAEDADQWTGHAVPEVLRKRLLSLRAFSGDGMMIDADVVAGPEVGGLILRLFENKQAAYLHAHNAGRGCFAARIDRS